MEREEKGKNDRRNGRRDARGWRGKQSLIRQMERRKGWKVKILPDEASIQQQKIPWDNRIKNAEL